MKNNHYLTFADVLRDEVKEILGRELPPRSQPAPDLESAEGRAAERTYEKQLIAEVDRNDTDLAALCLSGGGIRSATFALGVMQGLARFGLLGQFHYLSSVSGGGYIASWLSTWRSAADDPTVFSALNAAMATGEEEPQITGIRSDSNYLTPQLGLLSADTWTVITLYLRNLLLNWILFVPFFMGCLMLPRLCAAILTAADFKEPSTPYWFYGSEGVGGLLVIAGLSFGIYGRFLKQGKWLTNDLFKWKVLLPLVVSGALFTFAAVVVGSSSDATTTFAKQYAAGSRAWHLGIGALCGAIIYSIAWLIGRLASRSHADPEDKPIEARDVVFWTLSGALVGLLVIIIMRTVAGHVPSDGAITINVAEILGLSGCVLAYLAGDILYVGLASFSRKGEMDREWLARSSGWLAAVAVAWAAFSVIAVYGPNLFGWLKSVAAAGSVSGLITLLLGSSARTAATQARQTATSIPLTRIVGAAAVIFAVLIGSLLALFDQELESLVPKVLEAFESVVPAEYPALLKVLGFLKLPVVIDILLLLVLIGIALLLSLTINVNRFSMHALYRNRLVRAFLGSARAGLRSPDPFTSFDPKDNLPLAQVAPRDPTARGRLFHVINTTLNVVSSGNRAWQERKAESFTMSRLHCGNPFVFYSRTRDYGSRSRGGLTLGTAMAISGAAVSPNQGYNSSPLIGFLLMLFNVRLGWWLGSPKRPTYCKEGPTFSLSPALRELAGDTTDDSKWVYLTDGGHFENLGLYEMVRRRCRRIVVSDAGCDPTCSFEDLGNAVRKIYIDFGVSIEFESLEIKPRQNPPVPGLRFAIGSIKYPGSSKPGWLLYLKPTYHEATERADIRSYASSNLAFPHEATTDQWFSESQLESYRALGANVAEYVCSGGSKVAAGEPVDTLTLDGLFEVADTLHKAEAAKLQARSCCKCSREESP